VQNVWTQHGNEPPTRIYRAPLSQYVECSGNGLTGRTDPLSDLSLGKGYRNRDTVLRLAATGFDQLQEPHCNPSRNVEGARLDPLTIRVAKPRREKCKEHLSNPRGPVEETVKVGCRDDLDEKRTDRRYPSRPQRAVNGRKLANDLAHAADREQGFDPAFR